MLWPTTNVAPCTAAAMVRWSAELVSSAGRALRVRVEALRRGLQIIDATQTQVRAGVRARARALCMQPAPAALERAC